MDSLKLMIACFKESLPGSRKIEKRNALHEESCGGVTKIKKRSNESSISSLFPLLTEESSRLLERSCMKDEFRDTLVNCV